MRILITGVAGFVGRHLIEHLIKTHLKKNNHENDYKGAVSHVQKSLEITGVDIIEDIGLDSFFAGLLSGNLYKDSISANFLKVDLRKKDAVEKLIKDTMPDKIYHLAAQSSVSYSWENPRETFEINVFSGINIFDAVKKYGPDCRVLVTCTAEEYEILSGRALTESSKINPVNPYAISKAALDFFAVTYYRATGALIYVTRSFNHTGPGQSDRFVVSDFAKQIAEIEAGHKGPLLNVGNLNVSRDFLDVRDVVRAYDCILEKGRAGQVYNVCSGAKISISEILEILVSLSRCKNIKIKVDKNKIRPIDSVAIYGNNSKLKNETGWEPGYDIKASLSDTLNWWRERSR